MSIPPPPLKHLVLFLAVLAVLFLWFFDWSAWAWVVAMLFVGFVYAGWRVERAKGADTAPAMAKRKSYGVQVESAQPPHEDTESELREQYRDWNEDREVAESQREFETLWTGKKEISFTYRDKGRGKPQEVTAVVTKVISPEFGDDEETYFQGTPAGGALRYFCLGYLSKGRKVTDVRTGEVGTLRKILGVKRRVYK